LAWLAYSNLLLKMKKQGRTMRILCIATGIVVLLVFIFLYLKTHTVGRSDYLSKEVGAKVRPLFSWAILCLDNPLAKLIVIDLKVSGKISDDSFNVSGHSILGWHIVTINISKADENSFESCSVTWDI